MTEPNRATTAPQRVETAPGGIKPHPFIPAQPGALYCGLCGHDEAGHLTGDADARLEALRQRTARKAGADLLRMLAHDIETHGCTTPELYQAAQQVVKLYETAPATMAGL